MTTRVYGGCVEPNGFDLDNELGTTECPQCAGEAFEHYWDACEGGSINQYHTIRCTKRGHEEGDFPDDDDYDFGRDAEFDEMIADLGY